jgi:hypothetical protein
MDELSISRSLPYWLMLQRLTPEVDSCLENALRKHLEESRIANSINGCAYKNRLIRAFPLYSFWLSFPNMLRVYRGKKAILTSFDRICSEQIITLLVDPEYIVNKSLIKSQSADPYRTKRLSTNNLSIRYKDLSYVNGHFLEKIFEARRCCSLEFLSNNVLAIDWMKYDDKDDFYVKYGELTSNLFEFQNANLIGLDIERIDRTLLNLNNPIVNWLTMIKVACEKEENGLNPDQFRKTFDMIIKAVKYYLLEDREECVQYLNRWRNIRNLPSELKPPLTDIQTEMIAEIQYRPIKERLKRLR